MNNRAGNYVKQLQGELSYNAFIPNPLPPVSGIKFDEELINLLSKADQAIGRLDGVIKNIPNPDLFVMMYIKKEAVLSSQIEGTQESLSDILEKEQDVLSGETNDDVQVTLNYVEAMKYGIKRIPELPLSLRLIKEIHSKLLNNIREYNKTPGEFRKEQNWIGPESCSLKDAAYVPPPVHEMNASLDNLEKYFYIRDFPILIKCGIIHAQFETIHPFLDGNGRIGRLLITFSLCVDKIISKPVLYLSYFFKKNRQEYYNKLTEIRNNGDWENWLKFFLNGISETSQNVVELSNKILELQRKNNELLNKAKSGYSMKARTLLDKIYVSPVFSVNKAKELCGVSYNTAKTIIQKFVDLGIIIEKPEIKRDRKFYFKEYIDLLNEGTELK